MFAGAPALRCYENINSEENSAEQLAEPG